MQNAKCKSSRSHVRIGSARVGHCLHSAFCIVALLGRAARRTASGAEAAAPGFAPTSSPPLKNPASVAPRGASSWTRSIGRDRLVDLNARTLFVPASIAKTRQRRHRGRSRRLGLSIRHHSPHHGFRLSGNALRRSDHRRLRRSLDWRARRQRHVRLRRGREGRWVWAHRRANHRRRRCPRGASASALLGMGRPRLHDRRAVRSAESCGEPNGRDRRARALGRSPGDGEPRPARQWDAAPQPDCDRRRGHRHRWCGPSSVRASRR